MGVDNHPSHFHFFLREHNTQQNDIQKSDTQHNVSQHNDK